MKTRKIRNEQDNAWKDILDSYFKEMVHFCLPQLVVIIDWNKPIISLDKELQAITLRPESGKCILDKLFKVYLKDELEQWILLHLEIQGTKQKIFSERMYIYNYRIWDKYKKNIISCAILTDSDVSWRPNIYELGLVKGSSIKFEFLIIKIIDYANKKEILESSKNPFAAVILAQIAAIELKSKSAIERKNIKFSLTKNLYIKGFDKQEIGNLYKFIDFLISLPQELEIEYLDDVYKFEESKKMAYITNAERFGIEKGIKQGVQKGKIQGRLIDAKRMLDKGLNITLISEITEIPMKKIASLRETIIQELD